MCKTGLRDCAALNVARANELRDRVAKLDGFAAKFAAPTFNEVVVQVPGRAADVLAGKGPVLLLAGVSDPGNAGTLVRSAEAFDAATEEHARGVDPFDALMVPAAIVRLKQGLGRLIRSRADRGLMCILDGRLQTKAYGRRIMQALPPAHRVGSLGEVRAFLRTPA